MPTTFPTPELAPAVVPGYSERIAQASDYARDCKELWKNALRARNRLIVEAIDNGHPGHQAARDAKCKQPHIIRILSESDSLVDD